MDQWLGQWVARGAWRFGAVLVLALACACGTAGTKPDGGGSLDGGAGDAGADAGSAPASAFGVFAAFTGEFGEFSGAMHLDAAAYRDWAGARFTELGARRTRSNLQLVWSLVEPTLGGDFNWTASADGERCFQAATRHGVDYVAVFHEGGAGAGGQPALRSPLTDLPAWQRFAAAAVERFDGDGVDDDPGGARVHVWQVGNEIMGWTHSGRTAAQYVEWFAAAASAIRGADPTAKVVITASTDGSSGVDPFHQEVLTGLAARGVFPDAIDVHHWRGAGVTDSRMTAVPAYRAALDAAGLQRTELWSMEHGTWLGVPAEGAASCTPSCAADKVCTPVGCVPRCTTDATCPAARPHCAVATGQCSLAEQTQRDQARSLVYRYAINRAAGVSLILWNNLVGWRCFNGQCGSMFDTMGLIADGWGPGETRANLGTKRLAYFTYQALAARTDTRVAALAGEVSTGAAGVHAYAYRHHATGRTGLVAWADSSRTTTLPWSGPSPRLVSLVTTPDGAPLRSEGLTVAGGTVSVVLDADPVWLSDDASW